MKTIILIRKGNRISKLLSFIETINACIIKKTPVLSENRIKVIVFTFIT